MVEAIGARQARRYFLTAERFTAAEAFRIGLVHDIVPLDELDARINELLGALLLAGPRAQAECKALIRAVAHRPIDDARDRRHGARASRACARRPKARKASRRSSASARRRGCRAALRARAQMSARCRGRCDHFDTLAIVALAAALGWASGIRLYAVLFIVGGLGYPRLGRAAAAGSRVLAHPLVLAASGFMCFVEFFADKIPGVDSVWDVVHTFVRIPAGAALAASVFGDSPAAATLAAAILGGTLAAGSHFTKSGARAVINTSPEPFSNWAASFGEELAVGTRAVARVRASARGARRAGAAGRADDLADPEGLALRCGRSLERFAAGSARRRPHECRADEARRRCSTRS